MNSGKQLNHIIILSLGGSEFKGTYLAFFLGEKKLGWQFERSGLVNKLPLNKMTIISSSCQGLHE